MSIRAKLYAAIGVTVIGLAITAGVGIGALAELSGRFDDVQRAGDARALALQLKYDVTDFNGWQTAYGYDNGRSRRIFVDSVARFRRHLAEARAELTSRIEVGLLDRIEAAANEFMRVDRVAWAALQARRTAYVRQLFLGPEITNFQQVAAAAEELARTEEAQATKQEREFRDARRDALRLLILAAIVTGLLVVILLVTANDLARTAEGNLAQTSEGESEPSRTPQPPGSDTPDGSGSAPMRGGRE